MHPFTRTTLIFVSGLRWSSHKLKKPLLPTSAGKQGLVSQRRKRGVNRSLSVLDGLDICAVGFVSSLHLLYMQPI
jgi:hypothetical protein